MLALLLAFTIWPTPAYALEEGDRDVVCFFSTPAECASLEDTTFDLLELEEVCAIRVEAHDLSYDALADMCCGEVRIVKIRSSPESVCDPYELADEDAWAEDPSSPWP